MFFIDLNLRYRHPVDFEARCQFRDKRVYICVQVPLRRLYRHGFSACFVTGSGDKAWQTLGRGGVWRDQLCQPTVGFSLHCAVRCPSRCPLRSLRMEACRKSFWQTRFPSLSQSVSIRGVSTKLKVNSGRTTPPGQPSQRKLLPNSGIDHLDGFQVILASTLPLNSKGCCQVHLH
jgi:hypothetical protein